MHQRVLNEDESRLGVVCEILAGCKHVNCLLQKNHLFSCCISHLQLSELPCLGFWTSKNVGFTQKWEYKYKLQSIELKEKKRSYFKDNRLF